MDNPFNWYYAVFERPDGTTMTQRYIFIEELTRLVIEYSFADYLLVDIY